MLRRGQQPNKRPNHDFSEAASHKMLILAKYLAVYLKCPDTLRFDIPMLINDSKWSLLLGDLTSTPLGDDSQTKHPISILARIGNSPDGIKATLHYFHSQIGEPQRYLLWVM